MTVKFMAESIYSAVDFFLWKISTDPITIKGVLS